MQYNNRNWIDQPQPVKQQYSCNSEKAIFKDCVSRDYMIVSLTVVVIALLLWLYTHYNQLMGLKTTEKLDNRPRWMMGGLRDDTGATNNPSIFAKGYGLNQTAEGARTTQPHFDVYRGRSAYTDPQTGLKQGEYSSWGVMERGDEGRPEAYRNKGQQSMRGYMPKERYQNRGQQSMKNYVPKENMKSQSKEGMGSKRKENMKYYKQKEKMSPTRSASIGRLKENMDSKEDKLRGLIGQDV